MFPWRGLLLSPVTIDGTPLHAGELVLVESKQDGRFTVRALPASRGLTGTVDAGAVDEALCATIEQNLLGSQHVTWGSDQSGWRARARANRDFQLTGDESEAPVDVRQDEIVTVGQSGGQDTYAIVKESQFDVVPVGWVTLDLTRPLCTAALQLMCYELPAYAADLAGLWPDFMRTASQITGHGLGGAGSLLEYWAAILGPGSSGPQITRSQFSTVQLQRGDLVHMFSNSFGAMHTAVATGDSDWVYSLWHTPVSNPVRVRLGTLWDASEKNKPSYVRVDTPLWHRA